MASESTPRKRTRMGGLDERLGGKGKIQFQTSTPRSKAGNSGNSANSLIDSSFYGLLAFTIGFSCLIELQYSQGSAALVTGLIICGIWLLRARKHDNIRTAPEWYPIIGHFVNVIKHWHDFYDLETQTFMDMKPGEAYVASLPLGKNFVFITDPAVIDSVFRTRFGDAWKGPDVATNMEPMLGKGIFASDGEVWKRHRAIASRMFTIRSLRDFMFEVFHDTTDSFLNKLEELRTQGQAVDLYNMYNRLTLEAFTQVAFGVKLGCIDAAPKELKFATSFDRGFAICTLRFFDATWILKRLFGFGVEKELKGHLKVINEFIDRVVSERKNFFKDLTQTLKSPKSPLQQKYDILSMFLREDPNISEAELRDITINFIIAGRDTTAQLLSWFSYLLTQNPEVEAKIVEEIKEHLGDIEEINDDTYMDFHVVQKFTYLENALLETLRLRPSVPHLVRYAKVDIDMPDGHIIRKGDGVVIPLYAMGRMPWIWENPLKFDPTRFEKETYTPSQYPAFNIPPRLCLGKHVALMEAKIAVIRMLSKYKIVPVPGQDVMYEFSVTNQMKNGFKVKLEPRTQKKVSG